MNGQISMSEIEKLIKDKIQKSGVDNMIGEEKIAQIKDRVREILRSKKLEEEAPVASAETPAQPQAEPAVSNPNVSVKTTQVPEKTELVRKETELELKQKELEDKEMKLQQREKELEQKEKELSYKPELPGKLKEIGSGDIMVFSENELSADLENLSEREFRMKADPDKKTTTHSLWLNDMITKTNVYLVELKPIGQLVFDPYQGTTVFNQKQIQEPSATNTFDKTKPEHDVESAHASQMPEKEMLDMVQPIRNVSQPIVNPGPPEPAQALEPTDFRQMIEKIVQDELSRKNNYSLGPGPAGQGVY